MSRKIVDLHPEAIAEGREARQWYLSRSTQAEEAFRRELERAIRLIRETPETWPRYLHGTRRIVLTGFPYSIVYTTWVLEEANFVADANRQTHFPRGGMCDANLLAFT